MKQFAILGYPLGHTLSPQLHRLLARELAKRGPVSVFVATREGAELLEREALPGRSGLGGRRGPLGCAHV